jgi:S-methylmethionine-dependent homocysteine/selenocysteine methylase
MAGECAAVFAVGVNCTEPDEVTDAVRLAVQHSGRPGVAYPNSGESWDAAARGWSGTASFAPADAATWVAAGARLAGGCCRVGPRHIAALAARLRGGPTSQARGAANSR